MSTDKHEFRRHNITEQLLDNKKLLQKKTYFLLLKSAEEFNKIILLLSGLKKCFFVKNKDLLFGLKRNRKQLKNLSID